MSGRSSRSSTQNYVIEFLGIIPLLNASIESGQVVLIYTMIYRACELMVSMIPYYLTCVYKPYPSKKCKEKQMYKVLFGKLKLGQMV